jgi:ABC-2 type transport system permease protein
VVICIGLLLVGFLFFSWWNGGFWQADRTSLAGLFALAPWLLLVVASVVSMRVMAEEKRSGTLELLITLPVKDHEVILGKFLGAFGLVLYSAAAVAIGLLVSSLTESQAIAFFLTAVILFFLHVVGNVSDSLPWPWAREAVSFISFNSRLMPFAKGMINTRDIVYFVSITIGSLMVAFRALERRKWA